MVIAVLILLLAMLVPSLSRAREQARRVYCMNNLSHWGRAIGLYREDNRDYLPAEGNTDPDQPHTWYNELPPYLDAPPYRDVEGAGKAIRDFPELHIWICPSKNRSRLYKSLLGKNQFHYGMNLALDGLDGNRAPRSTDKPGLPVSARRFQDRPQTVLMFDIYPNSSRGYQPDVATAFHGDYANVLRLTGSVAGFRPDDFVEDGDFERGVPIWYHPELYWGYLPRE